MNKERRINSMSEPKGELKTEFIIRKKSWLDKYERFYLIVKQGNEETTLKWITSYIGEDTFESARNTLLKNLKSSLQFEDNTISQNKEAK